MANTVTQLKSRKMNRRFIQVVFQFILFSYLKNFTIISRLSFKFFPSVLSNKDDIIHANK